jgi:hypothetical protein
VVNDETAPKASSRLPGISFNDLKDRVYRLFVKNAPAWRHVGNGLNLEAECKTKSCLAYKKLVWIHQGTGKFDVFELIFKGTKCPMCHQDTENAISLGYVNCFVNIEGDQVPSLGGSIRCVETCQDGGIVTYTHKATKWIRLAITLTSKAP